MLREGGSTCRLKSNYTRYFHENNVQGCPCFGHVTNENSCEIHRSTATAYNSSELAR